jgi:hypothetical protein
MQFVLGAAMVLLGTFFWEHTLRTMFPAPTPPSKGYEAYASELRRLQPALADKKKRA